MAVQRLVVISSGVGYTNILATIPGHYLKIYEQGDRALAFNYKLPDDAFVSVYTSKAGDVIERIGHGRSGILGRPPNYNASGIPATGDVLIQINTVSGTGTTVVVVESESEL